MIFKTKDNSVLIRTDCKITVITKEVSINTNHLELLGCWPLGSTGKKKLNPSHLLSYFPCLCCTQTCCVLKLCFPMGWYTLLVSLYLWVHPVKAFKYSVGQIMGITLSSHSQTVKTSLICRNKRMALLLIFLIHTSYWIRISQMNQLHGKDLVKFRHACQVSHQVKEAHNFYF